MTCRNTRRDKPGNSGGVALSNILTVELPTKIPLKVGQRRELDRLEVLRGGNVLELANRVNMGCASNAEEDVLPALSALSFDAKARSGEESQRGKEVRGKR